uniref:Putative reverse transcriptase n=1 Tax=viral metagenome TaxID=1070528 RepID=A0A6M3KU29_9ZZZZ
MSKFYPSIDHDIMYEIIKRKIKCKDTLWLLRDIIYSYGGGKNVPIGNYTSQWFGNLYLNELDQWLKHEWKIKHYIRYCDDFVLFHNDKQLLQKMKNEIEAFIAERLQLSFSRWSIFPVTQGVDFLGYRHFPDYILLRKSTTKRVQRRLQRMPQLFRDGKISREQVRSSIASTKGWLQWANAHHLSVSLRLAELERIYETV